MDLKVVRFRKITKKFIICKIFRFIRQNLPDICYICKMKTIYAIFLAAILPLLARAGVNDLLPKPKLIIENGLTVSVKGLPVRTSIKEKIGGVPDGNEEAYSLKIKGDEIEIEATSEKGLLHAAQTLRQLAEPLIEGGNMLPQVEIADWPSFPWRGFMIDAGRSYISVDELKRVIDDLARFKMNVFHFHFTENQAWRLESKIYPQLNDSANMERQPGQYYTQDEARNWLATPANGECFSCPRWLCQGIAGRLRRPSESLCRLLKAKIS